MKRPPAYGAAVDELKRILATRTTDGTIAKLVDDRDEVLLRYGPLFTAEGLDRLTAEVFRDFLMFKNNRHWSGLERLGPSIIEDVGLLKQALHELLDESVPVATRLDALLPGGRGRVPKLGKAVLTPILLIAFPDRYGVWNGTSEGAMRELDIWPEFSRGESVGKRYEQVNAVLLEVVTDLDVDLWTLDALWWRVLKTTEEPDVDVEDEETTDTAAQFGLERHLHDFLLDNWERTQLAGAWDLVEEGGDIKGYGYERPTSVGKIDLLARHKTEPKWLVIELKRAQTSDDTMGQVQRYMGWVMEKLAEKGDSVEGLIIALDEDERLRYALKAAQGIRFMRYEVDFRLMGSKG